MSNNLIQNTNTISARTLNRLNKSFEKNLNLFRPQAEINSTEINVSSNSFNNTNNEQFDQIFENILKDTQKYEGNFLKKAFAQLFHWLSNNNRQQNINILIRTIKEDFLTNILKFNNLDVQTDSDLVNININNLSYKINIKKDINNNYTISFITNTEKENKTLNLSFRTDQFNDFIFNVATEFFNMDIYNADLISYYLNNNNIKQLESIINSYKFNINDNFINMFLKSKISNDIKPELINLIFNKYKRRNNENLKTLAQYVLNNNVFKENNEIVAKSLEILKDDEIQSLNNFTDSEKINLMPYFSTTYKIKILSSIADDDTKIKHIEELIIPNKLTEDNLTNLLAIINTPQQLNTDTQKKLVTIIFSNNYQKIFDNNIGKIHNILENQNIKFKANELKNIRSFLNKNHNNLNLNNLKHIFNDEYFNNNDNNDNIDPSRGLYTEEICKNRIDELKLYLKIKCNDTDNPLSLDKLNNHITYFNNSNIPDTYKKQVFDTILENLDNLGDLQPNYINKIYKNIIINKEGIKENLKQKINNYVIHTLKTIDLTNIDTINSNWSYIKYCIKNKEILNKIVENNGQFISQIIKEYNNYIETNKKKLSDSNIQIFVDNYTKRLEFLLKSTTTETTNTAN